MRLKLTLTLLAILLGLLTYIFYIDDRSDDTVLGAARSSVLGELAVGIDYLSIQNNATGQNITLTHDKGRWMLQEPYLWPANEFAVQRILTELRFLERISSFETNLVSDSGVSLPDYGLSPSQMAIMIGRGEKRSTLHIGKPTEIGNNLYILSTDQSHVHVVSRTLLDAISISLDSLRSSRLFDIAVFEATSWNIQVREADRNIRAWFARKGDSWVFETPIRARANSEAVNDLLNRCLSLEADSIVAASPTDLLPYGLQNPIYRIAIDSDQNRQVLEIGEKISSDSLVRYAKLQDRPSVFQLRVDFLELLANAQTKLRERRIFELDVTAATTVTIERRDQAPLTLQKLEEGNWELVVQDEKRGLQTIPGDTETITLTLKWLDELKVVPDVYLEDERRWKTGFVNDAPGNANLESYGLEVPEFSITITSNRKYGQNAPLDGLQSETLRIGDRTPSDPNESYIKIESKPFVYAAYNDIFSRISDNPILYKNRQIIDLPNTSKIQKISIERLSDKTIIADETIDPSAAATTPAAKLAQAIAHLTVDSFQKEGFTRTIEIAGRRTPWAYKLVATVGSENTLDAITQQIEIFVSEPSGGPLLYGGIPQTNQAFRFGMDVIDTFSKIVFDRVPREAPEKPFSSKPLPDSETSNAPSRENQFEAGTPAQPTDANE